MLVSAAGPSYVRLISANTKGAIKVLSPQIALKAGRQGSGWQHGVCREGALAVGMLGGVWGWR